MADFETMTLPAEPTLVATDGSDVRVLLHVGAGGMQFRAGDTTALEVIGVTMPPWPGDGEAVPTEGCPGW